jgi:hypothetical protein
MALLMNTGIVEIIQLCGFQQKNYSKFLACYELISIYAQLKKDSNKVGKKSYKQQLPDRIHMLPPIQEPKLLASVASNMRSKRTTYMKFPLCPLKQTHANIISVPYFF